MHKRRTIFISLSVGIAFLVWGCGGGSPVEETGWEETSPSSGFPSPVSQYEGPDTPGAASSGPRYEEAPPGLLGHREEWPEADQRLFIEIEKQHVEALMAYQAYMKGKEAGNMDMALLDRAVQLYEQIQTKLDPLIDKYPDDRAVSNMGAEVVTKLRALIDDLRVK